MSGFLRCVFLLSTLIPGALDAQFFQQGNKLVGSGGLGDARLGTSAAISADGNTAIVGGPEDDSAVGAAWVFVRTGGVWSQQGPKLIGGGAVGNANQGFSVAVSADGNTAVVGGPYDNGSTGAAWVFVRANGVWTQQGPKLTGSGVVGSAEQGTSVALSGDGNTVMVGGPYDGELPDTHFGPGGLGAVWIFTRTGGVWTQQGSKLVGTGAVGSNQGESVALSADGTTAIVGGFGDNNGVGAAWVFTQAGGAWTQQGSKLVGSAAVGNSQQGASIALSADGNTAVVGGVTDNAGAGAAWIFARVNGVWAQQGPKLIGNDAVGEAGQGFSVALSGDGNTAIIGGDDDNQEFGAVWVFTRANGVWSQQGSKLIGTGAARLPHQARAVALSADGHTAVVGGDDDQPPGSVWVFVSSPVRLSVSAPATVVAGSPFSFMVTAVDTNNLPVTSYTGTVHFSTTDPMGILPQDVMLTNGTGTFSATLRTGNPSPTITASDTVNQYISGTSIPIGIQSAGVASLTFSAVPTLVIPGVPFDFTVLAYDSFGNLTVSSIDRLHFSSSDGAAILPADSSLPAGGTFSAVLKTAGTQTITVTDTANPAATATSNPITVGGSIASSYNLALHSPASQSSTFFSGAASLAVDGNTDGNYYDGSVTATASDANAWWETDLGSSSAISTIVIWNRTDCCSSAAIGYWVFVSDTPFGPTDTASSLQHRAGTFASLQGGSAASNVVAVGAQGRYVRVQFPGTFPGFLSLAEVQVFGTLGSAATSGIAQGRPATQSSTYPAPGAAAASAVDGNTDGKFFDGSVTATNADPNAWWQVDLGASAAVRSVVIWNRTDCCAGRLTDYWVFVSDLPFLPTDTPATLQNRAATYSSHQTAAPSPAATIAFGGLTGVNGRYLRVQLSGTDYLSLAEVQVFGTPGLPSPANAALGKPASQSSTYPGSATDGASAAVDGNTDGNFFDGSVTATNLDPNPWWQVDLGASTAVSSIAIWNRTDCCDTRLSNYWVFISDTPFLATDTPATLQKRAGTFASYQALESFPTATISTTGAQGRYVRVQLNSPNYLSLAEVQVFGQ